MGRYGSATMLTFCSHVCLQDRIIRGVWGRSLCLLRRFWFMFCSFCICLSSLREELIDLILGLQYVHLHILTFLDLGLLLSFPDMVLLLNLSWFSDSLLAGGRGSFLLRSIIATDLVFYLRRLKKIEFTITYGIFLLNFFQWLLLFLPVGGARMNES